MLNKSIKLNMTLISNHFGATMCLPFIGFVGLFNMFIGAINLSALVVITAVVFVFGLNKIYGKSLYGDSAPIYMTLPISPKDIVLGKALTVSIWTISVEILYIICIAILLIYVGQDIPYSFLEQNMTALQTGLSIGFSTIGVGISGFVIGIIIMSVQLITKRNMTFITFIGIGIISGLKTLGINKLIALGINGFWLQLIEQIIVILIGIILYRFCVKTLTYKYNLG